MFDVLKFDVRSRTPTILILYLNLYPLCSDDFKY